VRTMLGPGGPDPEAYLARVSEAFGGSRRSA